MLTCRQLIIPLLAVLCCVAVVSWSACRRDESDDPGAESVARPAEEAQPENLLVFPPSLYVEDASVNDFLRRAMHVCVRGEYDAFRLLWSAREDPLARAEFDTGWQAVQQIRIRALQRVRLATDDAAKGAASTREVYAVLADVQLDPSLPAGQQEPRRDVVLMILREHDEWRLGNAPKSMRTWIKKSIEESSPSSDHPASEWQEG